MLRSAFACGWLVGLVGLVACSDFGAADVAPPDGREDGGDIAPVDGGIPAISVAIEPPAGTTALVQGATVKVTIKVTRGTGSQDPTKVSIANGLRDGITATSIEVPATATSAEIPVTVPAAANQGPLDLTVSASIPQQTVTVPLKAFVRGAPGALDTSFGTKGVARRLLGVNQHAVGKDLVVLADDRLIAVTTDGRAVRTSANGAVDSTYGTMGRATLPIANVSHAAADDTGAVVLAANGGAGSMKVGRIDPNGKADGTFGNIPGTGTTQLTPTNGGLPEIVPVSLAIRKDRSILLAFPHAKGGGSRSLGLVILDAATGAPNATAFLGGASYDNGALLDGTAPAVGVLPGGDFWTAHLGPAPGTVVVGRIDWTTGISKAGFGVEGENSLAVNAPRWAESATAFPDDSLLPAFQVGTQVWIPKFLPDGSGLDPTWATAGLATIDEDATPTVTLDKSGGVVVTLLRTGGLRFVRLTSKGKPDPTFGNAGTVVHALGQNEQIVRALVQKDGRIVVVCTETYADGTDVTLTRYWD